LRLGALYNFAMKGAPMSILQLPNSTVHTQATGLTALAQADQAVLDAIPTAVCVCDMNGSIVRFNRYAAHLWGRSPRPEDDFRFSGAFRLYDAHGAPLPLDQAPTAVALRTGESIRNREIIIGRPDGSTRFVVVDVDALKDGDGIVGAVNCFRDITDRKQAEAELERSRQELEDFFENATFALHLVSGDGTILRANQAELDLLGYSADEYIGRSITEFHVDAPVVQDILSRLSSGQRIDRYPARLRAKDGSIRQVQISSNAHIVDGELVNTRCFTVDVTQQCAAQEALKTQQQRSLDILDAIPVALYTTDRSGRITYYNRAAVEFSGREPTLGSDEWCVTWRLYEPDGTPLPHDSCPMAVALKEGREVRGAEAIAERPDGSRVAFIPFPTPLRDASGHLIGAVNMLVDISERKQAERAQQTLIHELNHRVKNTLATVHSVAKQTYRASPEPDAFMRDFEGRLLALSHAHDLLTRRSWSNVPLTELLESELLPYAPAAAQRIVRRGPEVALSPEAALALRMTLHELATNAAKYGSLSSDEGQVTIAWDAAGAGREQTITLLWTESEGPAVVCPTKRGFGTRFIERSFGGELEGSAKIDFDPAGVRCRIQFKPDPRG
jgi:PAS domain S-box-containing protein